MTGLKLKMLSIFSNGSSVYKYSNIYRKKFNFLFNEKDNTSLYKKKISRIKIEGSNSYKNKYLN